MTDHLLVMTLFSVLVSMVFAMLARDEPRAQLRFGVLVFLSFMGGALVLAWVLFPFPL